MCLTSYIIGKDSAEGERGALLPPGLRTSGQQKVKPGPGSCVTVASHAHESGLAGCYLQCLTGVVASTAVPEADGPFPPWCRPCTPLRQGLLPAPPGSLATRLSRSGGICCLRLSLLSPSTLPSTSIILLATHTSPQPAPFLPWLLPSKSRRRPPSLLRAAPANWLKIRQAPWQWDVNIKLQTAFEVADP